MDIRRCVVLAMSIFLIAAAATTEGIQYSEVKHKIVQKADAEGDILVSVKVIVTNGMDQAHDPPPRFIPCLC